MAGPFRILVVEDEPVIRELVKSLLTESECEVETASHAADGLKLAKTQLFDLVLLDVVLPPTGSCQNEERDKARIFLMIAAHYLLIYS